MSDPTDPAATGSSSPPSGVASSLSLQPQTQAPVQPMWVTDVLSQLDVDAFDWTAFEGTYKGLALIGRLSYIPTLIFSTPSQSPTTLALARAALLRLIPLLRGTLDVGLYNTALAYLARISAESTGAGARDDSMGADEASAVSGKEAEGIPDNEWIEEAGETERKENSRLDVELRGYMSNLIKESIRLTYLAFAQLALRTGKVSDALKAYNAARDYCSSPAHHVDIGVGLIETSLAYNQPLSLPGHISKLEASLDRAYPLPAPTSSRNADSASTTAADIRENREREARAASARKVVGVRLRVARGLVALAQREFEKAGREFGEVGEEGGLGDWEGQAISTSDIALITALCTLSTSTRDRIRRVLVDRSSFRSALDDSNRWILDLVRAFIDARYGDALALLNKHEAMLLLNPFVGPHTDILLSLIRTQAIVLYVTPFSSVQIGVMANAFGTDGRQMLLSVLKLNTPNPRNELFSHALKVGKTTNETTKAALIRMRLHEAGITVDPRPERQNGNGNGNDNGNGAARGLNPSDSLELPDFNGGQIDMDEIVAAM
ncbi:hypothetical protein EHS25_006298 [Saitozyma podzolica]|uniref:26S proteasome regulatory subunit Rpn7 N-terminal domain-containing protein n=1 Tax=Saitozyma podzolica TaxID=1890683 RepID=A0A427YRF4_9TREE|nr:hypothetical protein EHS25_006298 [Saitozyma podzolica]